MSRLLVWEKHLKFDLAEDQPLADKTTKIEWMKHIFEDDALTGSCTASKLTKRNEKTSVNTFLIIISREA